MIFGGVNAAALTGSLRCGYSTSYLPCRAYVLPTAVKTTVERTIKSKAQYTLSARIRNLTDTDWIELGTVTYAQVTKNPGGAADTADITVSAANIWSAYKSGGTYEDLLKPSLAPVEVNAGYVVGGVDYDIPIFRGYIADYTEAIGGKSSSISLRLNDLKELASRTLGVILAVTTATTFRAFMEQSLTLVSQHAASGYGSYAVSVFKFNDQEFTVLNGYGDVLSIMRALVTGVPILEITGSGAMVLGDGAEESTEQSYAFAYTDANIHTITRQAGAAQWNVYRTYGLVGGVGTTSEVQDDADVAKRGRLVYPPGFIGTPWCTLEYANSVAREGMAKGLRGTFYGEVPFNPYLVPGMRIKLTSTKANIVESWAVIQQVNHQVGASSSRTYLKDLTVVQV